MIGEEIPELVLLGEVGDVVVVQLREEQGLEVASRTVGAKYHPGVRIGGLENRLEDLGDGVLVAGRQRRPAAHLLPLAAPLAHDEERVLAPGDDEEVGGLEAGIVLELVQEVGGQGEKSAADPRGTEAMVSKAVLDCLDLRLIGGHEEAGIRLLVVGEGVALGAIVLGAEDRFRVVPNRLFPAGLSTEVVLERDDEAGVEGFVYCDGVGG